jgi:hypothetical protein
MTLTGHLTRSIFDRYHIVSSSDQVVAVRKLVDLQSAREREPLARRVVSLGEAVARRTGTLRAQSGRTRTVSREQIAAALRRSLASPMIPSWNRLSDWLGDMDLLRAVLRAAAD